MGVSGNDGGMPVGVCVDRTVESRGTVFNTLSYSAVALRDNTCQHVRLVDCYDDRFVVNACESDINAIPKVVFNDVRGSDVNATPIVLSNDDQFVVNVFGSDMNAIPKVLLNDDRFVVDACGSDMNSIPKIVLNDDRFVVYACGSDMNAIPRVLLNDDRFVVGVRDSDIAVVQKPVVVRDSVCHPVPRDTMIDLSKPPGLHLSAFDFGRRPGDTDPMQHQFLIGPGDIDPMFGTFCFRTEPFLPDTTAGVNVVSEGAVRLVTDFSGLETPSMALQELNYDVDLVAVCDLKPELRRFIGENFSPTVIEHDVFTRRITYGDLYVAGPPCVKFSHLGQRGGEPDSESSTMEQSIRYVEDARPKAFVIENVVGLMTLGGGVFLREVLGRLACGGAYDICHEVCNTLDFDLPQSRRRVYIVGICRVHQVGVFRFPVPSGRRRHLDDVLDLRERGESPSLLPPSSQPTARAIVARELKRLQRAGVDPSFPDRILDIDCSLKWASKSCTHSPCLTASRTRGLWLLSRGRRVRPDEALRLQGIDHKNWVFSMTSAQKFAAAGNSMSVSVLSAIFRALLPCIGFTARTLPSTGRSATGMPPASPTCVVCSDEAPPLVSSPASLGQVTCSDEAQSSFARPACPVWDALGALGDKLCAEPGFAELHAALRSPQQALGRQRDLFPLPLVSSVMIAELTGGAHESVNGAQRYIDAVVVGLNMLHGVHADNIRCTRPTVAQLESHGIIVAAALDLHKRLRDSISDRRNEGWESFEQAGSTPPLALVADAVSVPSCAATCDPRELIQGPLLLAIEDCTRIFPCPTPGLERFSGFFSGTRGEYVSITIRQLRAGVLRLAASCRGGGTVFPVGKSDGNSQRLVWNGTRASLAASRPPLPRHLADPSVFGTLHLGEDAILRVTKRDCRTWFDQLTVADSIGDFFGRPKVSRAELIKEGFSDSEIAAAGGDTCSSSFVPCSRVWPMGFSWSSCVAQETLLSICSRSNLDTDRVLSVDAPLPADLSLVFAVATDDLMIFSDGPVGTTTAAARKVESTMGKHGIIKAPEKDVNDVVSATCVGVDLLDGHKWSPPGARMWRLLDGILALSDTRRGSPGAVAGWYGVAGWYNLLRRLSLSVFNHVYDFASGSKAKDWERTDVPASVIGELLLDRVLTLFTTVDMRLPFLPIIGATDASTVYGHGAAVANLRTEQVQQIARLACKGGAHVQLGDGPELSEALLARLGPRHDVGLTLKDFTVVLCVKVDTPGHINLEEANALVGYLRWILRSRNRFRRRVVVLVDSKVVIGAVTKGRSSSVPLNAILRRIASICFAGGLVLHCIFVPTSHNPGDWPSRGDSTTWPRELRAGGQASRSIVRCPACGLLPKDHPRDQPRHSRGIGLCCRGDGVRYAYDHVNQRWLSDVDLWMRRIVAAEGTSARLRDLITDVITSYDA